MRCLWLVWSLFTWLAAILCTIGCLLPYWLRGHVYIPAPFIPAQNDQPTLTDRVVIDLNSVFPTDLGLFRRCGYPIYTSNHSDHVVTHRPIVWHSGCGHYSHVTNVPHTAWRIAFFALVSACVLLFFTTFFLSMLGFALYLISSRRVYRSCQALLLLSGILTVLSCILYPAGWSENPEIQQACGPDASIFQPGRCKVGWAYVLTCSGGLLSLFASMLPILFPQNAPPPNNKRATLMRDGRAQSAAWCCCSATNLRTSSTDGKDLDVLPLSGPSPTNSAQGADSVSGVCTSQQLENRMMFFQTRPDSPTGSSSPAASLLYEPPNPAGNDPQQRTVSAGVRQAMMHRPPSAMFVPVGLTQPPYVPYMCTYAPPRAYSTELLVGPSPLVNGMPPSQRVSVAVNPDPLIYLAEEDELGEKAENAYERRVDGELVDADLQIPENSEQSNVVKHPESSTDLVDNNHSDATSPTQPARRFQSTMNLANGNAGPPAQYIMVPALHPTLMPGVRWFSPYQYVPIPPGSAMVPPANLSTIRSEVIRRKRSSCML